MTEREACQERCAYPYGDPPCWRFDDDEGKAFEPCEMCRKIAAGEMEMEYND